MRSVLSRSTRQRCLPAAVVLLASLAAGSGCVDSPVAPRTAVPAGGASLAAGLELDAATAALTWSTGPTWSLSKTGALSGGVVTWTIVATEGPVAPGPLVVHGVLPLSNPGDAPAPIGNIVVNLQTRSGSAWSTVSSNVADARDGEDATTALIHSQASAEGKATFSENAASGSLQFTDATGSTAVSLVPQVVIGAGETRTLRYRATFDPNVLGLAAGMPVRIEVLVSYGNAPPGNSTPNLDIDGSGTVDAHEARVRSAATRLGGTVPDAAPESGTVTLVDGLDDISTTGTVTFSNAQFTLGATGGTVAVTVDGGTNGGSITNCAHLTGPSQTVGSGDFTFPMINGIDLEACKTIPVGATTPTPGAAVLSADLSSLVFGKVRVGSSAQVTLTEIGDEEALTVTVTIDDPANFSLANTPTSIAASGSAMFDVTCETAGDHAAQISVVWTSAVGGGSIIVDVSCNAPAMWIDTPADPFDFGGQVVGTPSAPQSFTITNDLGFAVQITNIATAGANCAEFQISATAFPISLASGATATIDVQFAPSFPGRHTCTLTVVDDVAGIADNTLGVTGTGLGQ